MADSTVEVQITADASGLETGLDQAATAASQTMAQISRAGAQAADGMTQSFDAGNEQITAGQKRLAASWMATFRPINQAFDRSITGMILGTTTWQKAVARIGQSVVAEELNAALKVAENWAISELVKTQASEAGAAARGATDTASQGGFLVRIAELLAKWLGLETSKTAATTAGDAARSAADTAAAGTGMASMVTRGFSQIEIDAAVAAAGAMAATAAIPIVGPELAPAAAAAAYAETLGWAAGLGGGVAGLDVGAWNVPSDMLAMVHAGETVMPENFASGLRAAMAGGGTGGGGGVTFAPQINALDARSVVALFNTPSIMRSLAKNLGAYMAINPSARGSY